ncbi:uncharacterized protein LOC113316065 [Papaver somniferum]|uniref:uncharacterized protein LOC113316065 n=1 Tax=Papaver somniferum TaxID=3469 RepID=UPI000E6FA613|nr:uncharacterized protein LOC113316065 [Papaver somniferum]
MATMLQANKQDIDSLGDTIARSMTQILLPRFPLNTTPPGFTTPHGNNGALGSTGGINFTDNISPLRAAPINLKFPTFDGKDPARWIFQADQYFNLHNVAEAYKISIATAHFKGEANAWYRWVQGKVTDATWLHFCSLICDRFADKKFVNPRMALSTIFQIGSVRDHIAEFEQILNFVTDLPEEYIIDLFIRSLKTEIRSILKSTGAQQRRNTIPPGAKRLTLEEQRIRRDQGLCFNCDQLYKPSHLCEKPKLLILEGAPEDSEEDIELINETQTTTINETEVSSPKEPATTISLHSLLGSPFPNTMRIQGHIKGQIITILIDSGSTHNFLHPTIAKRCGFIDQSTSIRVMVGDGGFLETQGSCKNIPVKLQDYSFSTEFFLLPVSGCDAVLGVHWLRSLGNISWDFSKLQMRFNSADRNYLLIGDNSTSVVLLDNISMQKLIHHEHQGILLQLVPTSGSSTTTSKVSIEISELLSSFYDIFCTPTSLPPSRLYDHHIPLLPNIAPINVRPYRYPHFQKEEIEKIVQELQTSAFIRHSCSPYSSPALLVRKKDGTWSFRTHDVHYEFLVMPSGLSNAPATFQSLMNDIFRPYLRKFVLVFFDDILIYNNSMSEYLQHLQIVFQLLTENKLFLKESKCDFAKTSISYLGHIVSADGIAVEPDKISAITNWLIPSTIKDLRGFLGLAGYYRKFVCDYGKISAALTKLLKKDCFTWSDEATEAFNKLKLALTTTPVLAFPDFSKDFYL